MRIIKGIEISISNVTKSKGFSLIEVMLALLILSFGLLGYSQSHLMALRTSEQAYFINLADLKNNALAESLQICNQQACIQSQLVLLDESIAKNFPEGEAFLIKQDESYQHKISWLSHYYQAKPKLSLPLLFPQ